MEAALLVRCRLNKSFERAPSVAAGVLASPGGEDLVHAGSVCIRRTDSLAESSAACSASASEPPRLFGLKRRSQGRLAEALAVSALDGPKERENAGAKRFPRRLTPLAHAFERTQVASFVSAGTTEAGA